MRYGCPKLPTPESFTQMEGYDILSEKKNIVVKYLNCSIYSMEHHWSEINMLYFFIVGSMAWLIAWKDVE